MFGKSVKSNYRVGPTKQLIVTNIFLFFFFFLLYEIPNSKGQKWSDIENSSQFTRLVERVNYVLVMINDFCWRIIPDFQPRKVRRSVLRSVIPTEEFTPASLAMKSTGSFPGIKWPESECDPSPSPHFPYVPSWRAV